MTIYVNILGNWIGLTENDIIDGCPPHLFVEKLLISEDAYETSKLTNEFFQITIKGKKYHIHKSQIQYIE